jgi:hypothetical protein
MRTGTKAEISCADHRSLTVLALHSSQDNEQDY